MATAVHLASQSRALQQDIFEAKAEAFLDPVPLWRQFQLGLLDTERPFQRCLHAQRTLYARATYTPDPSLETHGSNPSNSVIWAGRWAAFVGRHIHGPEAMGRSE
jgi:hypothetical protein